MSTLFLTAGQSQLLDHIMVWGNLRIGEITADPFASSTPIRSRDSTQSLMLPSLKVTRYLDRVKAHETRLLSALGIDTDDLEKELAKPGGIPTLSNYIWTRRPAWIQEDMSAIRLTAMDDISQIRMVRTNILDKVMQWKRTFGPGETMASQLNVQGFENNLVWLRETYAVRHLFASELVKRSRHGWDLVQAFYDPAARAAQNMMDGMMAVQHYGKKAKKPSGV